MNIYIYKQENKKKSRQITIGNDFKGNRSNVIKCKRNMQNEYAEIHRALMPIELANKIIKDFTNENDIVLDIFNGLGTTMMSCILNNRTYYGIEISPLYCQYTIKRFLKYDTNYRNIKIIRNDKEIPFNEFKDYVLDNQITIFD